VKPPYRIDWLDEAQTDVRRLDRSVAMRIFGVRHRSEAYR